MGNNGNPEMPPDQIQLFLDGLARLTRETDMDLDIAKGVSLRPRTSGNYAAEKTPLGYRIGVLDADDNRITGHKNTDLVGRRDHVQIARAISATAGVAASRRTMTLPLITSIVLAGAAGRG